MHVEDEMEEPIKVYDRLMSIAETAKMLGVAESTVRWWIQVGRVSSNKPCGDPTSRGGRRLVPVSEVNRIIRETRIPASAVTK